MAAFETFSQDKQKRIVVVGAGIGGLTAGLELAHAGFEVCILERSSTLSEVGAGIQISPNAGRVLSRIGLDRSIAASSTEPVALEARDGSTGAQLSELPGEVFRDRYKFPYRIIHRADLQAALIEGCERHDRVSILKGATVSNISENADGARVSVDTAQGELLLEAVAVIAADGVRSATRALIPGSSKAKPAGVTAWRTIIPADLAGKIIAIDKVTIWLGRGGHVVHYPISRGDALNVVAMLPQQSKEEGWSVPGEPADIARTLRLWAPKLRDLISLAPRWQKFAVSTVAPDGAWTHGRVALLGDAAHAMLPFLAQGAAMAMEDAAVLSQHLRSSEDIPLALRAYETERRNRVERVAAATRSTSLAYHATGPVALARNAALRIAGTKLMLNRNDWIYRWKPPAP